MRYNGTDLLSVIEPEDVDPDVFELAKELASYFKSMCKASAVWIKPYNDNIPIEHQKCFQHFIKTAELVLEIQRHGQDVGARDFIAAQFEGLSFTNNLPYMSQLHTPAATVRYKNYLAKRVARAHRNIKEDDVQGEDFTSETRKATRLAERLGVSVSRALKMLPREFSEEFLRHRGVWNDVKDSYLD